MPTQISILHSIGVFFADTLSVEMKMRFDGKLEVLTISSSITQELFDVRIKTVGFQDYPCHPA